ncbi:MAG: glycosyltransferase [Planctomycetes bacterium]|nr:glycosyltransferase [Planctomycetota bacterium]
MAPRISALVPSYNHAPYVGDAVESVLAQVGLPPGALEVVIVDDGSTDGSPEVLRRFADDPRVRLELRDNRGISPTFQRLLELAEGEFVAYCCSDDRWHPEHLAPALRALEEAPDAAVCFGRARVVDGQGREHADSIFSPLRDPEHPLASLLRDGNSLCFVAAVFRRELALDAGGFDFGLRVLQDYDLWLKLVARGRALFRADPSVDFRWDGNNASGPAASLRKREDLIRVLERALKTSELLSTDPELRSSVTARVRRSHLRVARRVGDRAKRREHLKQARALGASWWKTVF